MEYLHTEQHILVPVRYKSSNLSILTNTDGYKKIKNTHRNKLCKLLKCKTKQVLSNECKAVDCNIHECPCVERIGAILQTYQSLIDSSMVNCDIVRSIVGLEDVYGICFMYLLFYSNLR